MPTKVLTLLAVALPWLNPFAVGPSPPVVQYLVTVMCVALLLLVASRQADRSTMAGRVAWGWLMAALVSCAIALLQYLGLSEPFSPWINTTVAGQAFANLRQRNQFATLANTGLIALLYLVTRTAGHDRKWPALVPWLLAAALLALGNAASLSRTGAAQLLAISALALVWKYWRGAGGRQILAVAVVVYGLGSLLLPLLVGLDPVSSGMLGRFHDNAPACSSRLILWSNVLHLIGQKPWLGWGWGELDYAHFITLYPGSRFCDILDNAHNLPLHLAVELGIPVALMVCVGGMAIVCRAKPWREQDAARRMAWGVLAVILLHSMLEYPLWYGPFQMAFGLAIMLLWRAPSGQVSTAPFRAAKAKEIPAVMALALTVGVAYVAWDYFRISQIYMPPDERIAAFRDDTLEKIKASRLFHEQVAFAELTTTPLALDNAARIHALALEMLHFSPESRVVEKLIESATLLGRQNEVAYFLARFRAAFPEDYARWSVELRARRGGSAAGAD